MSAMSGYPLAVLLRAREREERAARLAAGRARAEEEGCRAERDAASAAADAGRARARAARLAAGAGPVDAAALGARARFAERLRREAGALEGACAAAACAASAAAAEAVRCVARLAEARSAVRALELHRERWRARAELASQRREEATADDAVSARRAVP